MLKSSTRESCYTKVIHQRKLVCHKTIFHKTDPYQYCGAQSCDLAPVWKKAIHSKTMTQPNRSTFAAQYPKQGFYQYNGFFGQTAVSLVL